MSTDQPAAEADGPPVPVPEDDFPPMDYPVGADGDDSLHDDGSE